MKETSKSEFDEFTKLVDRVLSVPHSEIVRREKEYQKQAAQNPKRRGPKRKVNLVEHLANQFASAFPVARCLAIVEPESLFVQIPEQVERFDAYIGSLEPALKQVSEAFQVISMNVAVTYSTAWLMTACW
jgi:hypothetical protein